MASSSQSHVDPAEVDALLPQLQAKQPADLLEEIGRNEAENMQFITTPNFKAIGEGVLHQAYDQICLNKDTINDSLTTVNLASIATMILPAVNVPSSAIFAATFIAKITLTEYCRDYDPKKHHTAHHTH